MSRTQSDEATVQVQTAELSDGERYRLLASNRRRLVLDVLADRCTPAAVADLAAAVAEREADTDAADDEAVRRVAVSLHHVHLPKLDAAGVVDYDRESNLVA